MPPSKRLPAKKSGGSKSSSGSRLPPRRPAAAQASGTQNAGGQAMSPPLPFGFMKGLERLYFQVRKTGKDNVERLYVYFEEVSTGKKFKQSFVEPRYVEQLEALGLPTTGDKGNGAQTFDVQWKGRGDQAELVLTPQEQ